MTDPVVLSGGPVLTLDPTAAGSAVAVHDGWILAVGGPDECRAAVRAATGRPAREVDLDGRALLPGFVDPHCHPVALGQLWAWVDVSPRVAADIPAIVRVLREAAERLPAGAPLRAYGYEHRNLAEGRHPDRRDLDQVATDRDVYVMDASGHGGAVNSRLLAACGIDAGTPDPPGGRIERDAAGEPTGLLWDAACDALTGPGGVKVGRHGPNFHLTESGDALRSHLLAAEDAFLRAGVTTVGDAQVSQREMAAYLSLHSEGGLRVRASLYVLSSLLDEVLGLGLVRPFGDDVLRFAGIKFYADGTLGGGTAYFPEGYADDPCRHGQLYHDPADYQELVVRAHRAGLQTGTHAQSPTAIGMVLDAVRAARAADDRPDPRHRIEHCGLPTDEQIALIGALGVIPVAQPQHHANWGDGVLATVGVERGGRFNPLGAFERAGIPYALSSDAPVADPGPLPAVAAAATRTTVHGTVLGPPELAVTVEQALAGHTRHGARALRREHEIGSIAPGKRADLVLLDADPRAVAPADVAGIGVTETWVGGTRVR